MTLVWNVTQQNQLLQYGKGEYQILSFDSVLKTHVDTFNGTTDDDR